MMEGLFFAREIGMPLNTHLIIHWGGTLAGDDPDGELFAKLRYLLDKRFRRKYGVELIGIWVRERHRNRYTRQQSEVVHSHLLLQAPACLKFGSEVGTGFSANAIQFFFGGRFVDPLKALCEAFFELEFKGDGAPSFEIARSG
jgi:hypothetical protein